jgi:pectinesterase
MWTVGLSVFTFLWGVQGGASPPAGALVVGSGGQYRTVQSAVNAASPGKTIFIQPGTYKEQVFVQKNNITIIGSSSSPDSYSGNTVTITNNLSQDKGLNNDKTGTLRAHGNNFRLYNVNLVNTRGRGSQALALSAYGDRQGYYGCQFKGFQDTILSEKGHHYFSHSMIQGATDFIFGQHAQSWFEKCDIKSTAPGFITGKSRRSSKSSHLTLLANGRDSSSNPSYYVLNRCNVDGSAGKGKTYLGRPWRAYARVVFQNSRLGSVIHPEGWSTWSKGDARTSGVYFGEYGNTGPGASGSRARFSKKLSSPVSLNTVISGASSWVDSKFLGR